MDSGATAPLSIIYCIYFLLDSIICLLNINGFLFLMFYNSFVVSLFLITPCLIAYLLYRQYTINKNKRLELISAFLRKVKTLPEPYESLDLNFATYFPEEDKLNFIYRLNKNIKINTYKVYRWRLNGEICFVLTVGTDLGTHLLYVYTKGKDQIINSYTPSEVGFCYSTEELVDIIKIA